MLLLAAVSHGGRRAALTDALTEAAFAVAGFSASIPDDHISLSTQSLSWRRGTNLGGGVGFSIHL
jgi:hypothetical protein